MRTLLITLFTILITSNAYACNWVGCTNDEGQKYLGQGQWQDITETSNYKNSIKFNGYFRAGSNIYFEAEGESVSVALNDLRGKNKSQIRDVITIEIAQSIGISNDIIDAVSNGVAEVSNELAQQIARDLANSKELQDAVQSVIDSGFNPFDYDSLDEAIAAGVDPAKARAVQSAGERS